MQSNFKLQCKYQSYLKNDVLKSLNLNIYYIKSKFTLSIKCQWTKYGVIAFCNEKIINCIDSNQQQCKVFIPVLYITYYKKVTSVVIVEP